MQGMSDKQLGGRYKVLEAFEHGLKCHDEQTSTFVWLKPLPDEITSNPALLEDAIRRCETLKNIQNDGIARMLDVLSAEDGKTYMVMEYAEGVTLRHWMQEHREDGVVPAKFAIPILKQLASALDAAHTLNEIHRHLMPECIMVDEKGKVKILNLGIPYAGSDNAWMLEPWKSTGWEAFYRAPEQWRGQICTAWTDLYALGCIAYEMLSGHVPFDIPDINLLHGAVLTEMPPTIISLAFAAQETIARSLAKRGSERFNSCEDYIRSLSFETAQTKTVPKTTTGKVPPIQQSYAVSDIPNRTWAATPTAASFVSNPQDTGSIRGATRGISIALPNIPNTNTGTVRNVTRATQTGPVTGKYTRSKTHVITDPLDIETESSWNEESQGVKGVLVRVVMPLILVLIIASLMYYLFIRQLDNLEHEDFIDSSEFEQYTPNALPDVKDILNENEDNSNERKSEEQKKEQDKSPSDDSSKPSGDSYKEQTDDSSKTEKNLQNKNGKPEAATESETEKNSTSRKETPATDDEPSSTEPDKESNSTDANSISVGQDDQPQPLSPREDTGTAIVKKKKPAQNTPLKDGYGTAYIVATIKGKTVKGAKLTIGEQAYMSSAEISAFVSENRTVEVKAEYQDERHATYTGTRTITINKIGRVDEKIELIRDDGVAVIVPIADGKPLEGADVYVDGRLYKTPNCEIETFLGIERKVDVKVFFKDPPNGLLFGSQSFVIDWKGPKTIYVEMKERKAVASAEQSVRLLPLNVDDLADGSVEKAMAASYSVGGDKASTDQGAAPKDGGTDGMDKPMFMELIWVDPGSFEMGSDAKEAKRDEKPRHTVQISNGFWLGKYEVTQEEYRALAQYAGLDEDHSKYVGARLPVDSITKKKAEKWCEALTRKERAAGRLPFGYEYRLPTEAEWEFAARGGRKSRGYLFSGGNKLIDVAWFDANRGTEDGSREVGGKEKNELGFYDMSGNVREWCHDFYEAYSLKPVTDPMGRGNKVMARGGSWRNNTNGSRVTERASYEPNKADDFIGFRVALAPVLPE